MSIAIYGAEASLFAVESTMIDLDRLRHRMTQRSMSQGELARLVNVTPAAIQQLLNGKTKRTRVLREIAAALNVSAEWLEGHDVPQHRPDTDVDRRILYFAHPRLIDPSRIPNLLDATTDVFAVDQRLLGDAASHLSGVGGAAFVTHFGHDMQPTLAHGDMLFVRTDRNVIDQQDALWLILTEGLWMVRRLRLISGSRAQIIADRPGSPELQAELSDFVIYGKVVWFGRSLPEPV